MMTPHSLVQILAHFSNQNEGSRDLYDFIEFNYNSQMFKDISVHDLVSILYSFYSVHAGTKTFLEMISNDLILKMDDRVTTFDLLRVLQSYSEIAEDFPKLFMKLETMFLNRFD